RAGGDVMELQRISSPPAVTEAFIIEDCQILKNGMPHGVAPSAGWIEIRSQNAPARISDTVIVDNGSEEGKETNAIYVRFDSGPVLLERTTLSRNIVRNVILSYEAIRLDDCEVEANESHAITSYAGAELRNVSISDNGGL